MMAIQHPARVSTGLRSIPPALLVFFGLLLGCGGDKGPSKPGGSNEAPSVAPITVGSSRVLTHMKIFLQASAHDADDTVLHYTWGASAGEFPIGTQGAGTAWRSPDVTGADTVWVDVSDGHQTVRQKVVIRVQPVAPPADLAAIAGASIADLSWTESADRRLENWTGYEIYASTRNFDAVPPESLDAYRIGSSADPAYRASGLTRGAIYHFRVASLRSWSEGEERSTLTGEVELAPRSEWTKQLTEIGNPEGALAVDLSTGEVHPLDAADASGLFVRDLYFGTSDPMDGPGTLAAPAAPRLKSVSLLANRNGSWAQHIVRVKLLGEDWNVDRVSDNGWSEEVDLEVGKVYAVRTMEGNFAKFVVTELTTVDSPYRHVTVRWAFQSIPWYPRF